MISSKSGAKNASKGKKRKANDAPEKEESQTKRLAETPPGDAHEDSDYILINRAPVLELFGSCVTHLLYPELSWNTCLSAGSAISSITAISKGRSIGTMRKSTAGEAEEKRQKRAEREDDKDVRALEVMSFSLQLDKEGHALVGDKPKKPGEEALRKKYGGSEKYDKVKHTFDEELAKWKGREDDLNAKAFHMYEGFRPSVKAGQAGWGRKGQLSLDTVRSVVAGEG